MKLDNSLTMAAGLLVLTEYVSGILKKDPTFYKQKNKVILNQLIMNNKQQLLELKKVTDLMFYNKETEKIYEKRYLDYTGEKMKYDPNFVLEDMSFLNNIFRLFIRSFLVADENQTITLFVALQAIVNKQKILAGKEIEIFAKSFAKEFVNYEISEEQLKKFIEEYGTGNSKS